MPFLSTYIDVRTLNFFPACRILIGQFKFSALHRMQGIEKNYNVQRFRTTGKLKSLKLFCNLINPHVNSYFKFLCKIYVLSTNNRKQIEIVGKKVGVQKYKTEIALLPRYAAPVAQWASVLDFSFKGCGFESHRGWNFSFLTNIPNRCFRLIFTSLARCECNYRVKCFRTTGKLKSLKLFCNLINPHVNSYFKFLCEIDGLSTSNRKKIRDNRKKVMFRGTDQRFLSSSQMNVSLHLCFKISLRVKPFI